MTNQLTGGGSVTGRWNWSSQRITGKSAVLGMGYGGSLREGLMLKYDRMEERIHRNSEMLNQSMGGKRHKMKRASDRNANAKLRHAQATLLGWQFKPQRVGEVSLGLYKNKPCVRWWAYDTTRTSSVGVDHLVLGPYSSRHRAVVAALKDRGLEA